MTRRHRQALHSRRRAAARLGRVLSLASLAPLALAAFVVATPASAGTLDQQQTSANSYLALESDRSGAQTFTAGISGGVDQVDLSLYKAGTPPPITVEIRNASAGLPGTAVLASSSVAASAIGDTPAFVPVRFASPAPVSAGTQYTIVAYSPGMEPNVAAWQMKNAGNPYPLGASFFTTDAHPPDSGWLMPPGSEDGSAFTFKTYVAPLPQRPPLPSTVNPTATCKGQAATQVGTGSADVLTGTDGADVIVARGGDDTINSHGGDDLVCGGEGGDAIKGANGADRVFGEDGNDRAFGGAGGDEIDGGAGNDVLRGSEGKDRLFGQRGNDTCTGGKGRDIEKSC